MKNSGNASVAELMRYTLGCQCGNLSDGQKCPACLSVAVGPEPVFDAIVAVAHSQQVALDGVVEANKVFAGMAYTVGEAFYEAIWAFNPFAPHMYIGRYVE